MTEAEYKATIASYEKKIEEIIKAGEAALKETVNLINQRKEVMAKIANPMTHWAVRENARASLECIQESFTQSLIEYGVWKDVYNILKG